MIDELVAAALPGPHIQPDPEDDPNDIYNDWGGDNNSETNDDEGEDLRYKLFEEIVKPK